ncbi:MAG: addiction module protein [Pleurocapsa sp. SU_196_0]|nr:addiction module protein [Pleurocapsa sp. SU_196_0]
MSVTLEELKALSVSERAWLAQVLWDSVFEEETALPLSDEHRTELERRLNDPNPQRLSWNEAKQRLKR